MKRFLLHITLALAAIGSGASASAAIVDYFLKLDGIDGESADVRSARVAEWRWIGVVASGHFDPYSPVYLGGVRVAAGDTAQEVPSRWSSLVLKAMPSGPGAGLPPHLELRLLDVTVSPVAPDAAGAGDWLRVEGASAVTLVWRPMMPDGRRGLPLRGHWDAASGRFSGDIGVLGAFDELGALRWSDGSLSLTTRAP